MSRIEELADLLLRDGHVDNEPDARLAAIHILLAAEARPSAPRDHDAGDGASEDHAAGLPA